MYYDDINEGVIEEIDEKGNKKYYLIKNDNKELRYSILNNGDLEVYVNIDGLENPYKVIFRGFKNLREIKGFNKKWGYLTSNFGYRIWRVLNDYVFQSEDNFYNLPVIIVKDGKTRIEGKQLILSYEDYEKIYRGLLRYKSPSFYLSREKKFLIVNQLSYILGNLDRNDKYKKDYVKGKNEGIDEWMVIYMDDKEKQKIEKIYYEILRSGYVGQIYETKRKLDLTYLDNVIENFEKYLNNSRVSESQWGRLLKESLFLLYGRYISIIEELPVDVNSRRRVDFGMIDFFGFLDIFEIKRPTTKILSKSKDRGNYYWHNETIKAIIQAEKYLYYIERNPNFVKSKIGFIKDTIEIIRPRVYLIIGHSNQFDNEDKKRDFRILKNGLKNIEIITYDELLLSFKNLRDKLNKI